MSRVTRVVRLHLNKPETVFGVPLYILGTVMLISAIIVFTIQRAGGDPASAEYAEGARMNMGMVWALPGFLVYLGVQMSATSFPFALALGSTRRAYVAGTAIACALQAAYLALVFVIMLGLELATGHWFVGIYLLDIYVLGAGNVWQLAATAFLGVFLCLSIGSVFGASWVRFGPRGPVALGLGLAVLLALALLIAAPHLGEIVGGITGPGLALAAVGLALLALLGTWLGLRRAAIR